MTQQEKVIEKLSLKETDKTFGVSVLNGKVYEYKDGLFIFFGNHKGEKTKRTCILFKVPSCYILLSNWYLINTPSEIFEPLLLNESHLV